MKRINFVISILALTLCLLCACGTTQTSDSTDKSLEKDESSASQAEPADNTNSETKEKENDEYAQYDVASFEATDKGTDNYGYRHFDIKITNNGDFPVTLVSPIVDFVDSSGNILGTSSVQVQGNLKPGNYAVEDALIGSDSCDISKIAGVVIENYDYRTVGFDTDLYVRLNTLSQMVEIYEL